MGRDRCGRVTTVLLACSLLPAAAIMLTHSWPLHWENRLDRPTWHVVDLRNGFIQLRVCEAKDRAALLLLRTRFAGPGRAPRWGPERRIQVLMPPPSSMRWRFSWRQASLPALFGTLTTVSVSLWVVYLAMVTPSALLLLRRYHIKKKREKEGLCRVCGYDLRGSTSGQCTECGSPMEPRGPRTTAQSVADASACVGEQWDRSQLGAVGLRRAERWIPAGGW